MTGTTVSEDDWIPSDVKEKLDRLEEATGIRPTLTTTGSGFAKAWHMEVVTDRVRLTGSMRAATRPGRFKWGHSTLAVDGVPRETVANLTELAALFAAPSTPADDIEPVEPTGPTPVPVSGTAEDAPSVVRKVYNNLVARVGSKATVSIGGDKDHWIIGLDSSRVALRLVYRSVATDRWSLEKDFWDQDRQRPIELFVEGVDHSDMVKGKLDEALAMALNPGVQNPTVPAIRQTAASTRSNAVETRRATVIRN